jgi:hypothetical protein
MLNNFMSINKKIINTVNSSLSLFKSINKPEFYYNKGFTNFTFVGALNLCKGETNVLRVWDGFI